MTNPLLELLSKLRREFTTQINRPYFETLEAAIKKISDDAKSRSGSASSSVNLAFGLLAVPSRSSRSGVTFDVSGGGISFDNDFWTFDS